MKENSGILRSAKPENTIPKRSKQAIEDLVDLSSYYTSSLQDEWAGEKGVTLEAFPTGIHAYFKGAFDVRGLIQLAGAKTDKQTAYAYPRQVKGIQVNGIADKIDFLQGAIGAAAVGTKIGQYVLHYENGSTKEIPILYGLSVRDFKDAADCFLIEADTVEAGNGIRLYKYTVNNPSPELAINEIDFVSESTDAAPFVVAITMEVFRSFEEHEWFDSIRIYNDIIPRSKEATEKQIDLSDCFFASLDDDWFNHAGHDLHDVPKGIQEFGGVKFDVRGLIVLASGWRSLKITGLALPEEFNGIQVNLKGKSVSFLQATAFDSPPGTKIGAYIIHYADGSAKEVPLVYRENIMDWWESKTDGEVTGPYAKTVWYGSNAASRRYGLRTRLIKFTWENPLADVEITRIDIKSELENAAPMLFAITVE